MNLFTTALIAVVTSLLACYIIERLQKRRRLREWYAAMDRSHADADRLRFARTNGHQMFATDPTRTR